MTFDGANTLTYDAEGRAVSSTNGTSSGTYTYDGNGLRVISSSGSTTTVYIFSGGKVIAEYDNGAAPSSPSREYIYSGSQLLATVSGGATTYQHPDHLSVRLSTDSSGNVTRTFGHFPFGEAWYETGTASKWKFTSRVSGFVLANPELNKARDTESNNDYALARFYSNPVARFTSPDPLAGSLVNPQSLNRYAYTANDPIDFIDPLGLDTVCLQDIEGNPVSCYDSIEVTADAPSESPWGFGGGGQPHYAPLQDTPDLHGGGINFEWLKAQALKALLNPDCAKLFGGFKNAVTSLLSSSYNIYTAGEANPYPAQFPSSSWQSMTNFFTQPTAYGYTHWSSSRPGGIIFFAPRFGNFDPGFAPSPDLITQMTGFLHEQEHAANHSNLLDAQIDASPATYAADARKINQNCTVQQIPTQGSPLPGELTPQ
jgi:RHS repeat-associated protein